MKLAIDMARFAAWATLTFLFLTMIWLGQAMHAVPAQLAATLKTYERDGVLAGKAVNDLRLTLDNVNKGAIEEREYLEQGLPATVNRMNRSLDDTDALLQALRGTAEQANAAIAHAGPVLDGIGVQVAALGREAEPVLANAAQTEAEAADAVRHLDAMITAPELKATLASVRDTSANVAAGSAEATVILRDARREADALVAPKPWYKRAWSDGLKVGELVWDFTR